MTKIVLLMASLACGGCADNATSLADRIAEAASRLSALQAAAITTSYEPVAGATAPYTVVFFPSRSVAEGDLVAAGADKVVASRIYKELGYLGSMADLLVVDQDGQRLTFTTSWRRFAEVRDLVVTQRKNGTLAIELRREAETIRVVALR
jgi:hypothetical protein